MTEEQIFLSALDLPDAAARDAYLVEACGEDVELRGKVAALLAAHFKSGEFMDVPAVEQIGSDPSHAVTIQSDAMSAKKNPDDDSDSLEFLAPPTRPDSLGRIGHYEVLQELGRGGFGIVLRAFDDVLQRVVALKVMAPQMAATSPARKRFLREARSSAQVRHENVVQVYEVGEQPLPYLVMEFIPGETLQQKLDRMGPLEVPEVLKIGRQIAEGLAAAHANDLIHRDIKPGNVLLEGGQHKVKITDFGLARAADDASMTQSGQIAGTPMYMAPEQALGETLDQRADLFSLGSVLYQMVAGRPPFRANTAVAVLKRVAEDTPRNIREVIPETPQWLCDIIAKLHAKNPDDRYQSAREVADVLANCEAQLKASSKLKDFSRIPRVQPQPSGHRKALAVATAIFLLPLIALAVTEATGLTHLFLGRLATTDPIKPNAPPTPIVAVKATPDAEGWVQLFNRKDLTGWEVQMREVDRQLNRTWSVEGGNLVGTRGGQQLVSERKDYNDFHLRLEAKVNQGGNSGVIFRRQQDGSHRSYEAELNGSDAVANGSLALNHVPAINDARWLHTERNRNVVPDTWFTLEIMARGANLVTLVNGKPCAEVVDATLKQGGIELQVATEGTVVQIRKIEIKELPPEEPGWVQLFNRKDLDGWGASPADKWKVVNGEIVGEGLEKRYPVLFTKTPFGDFHLRAEVKLNGIANGTAGLTVRGTAKTHAEINIGVWETERRTGSLALWADEKFTYHARYRENLFAPNTWLTLEVIARGKDVTVKVNGTQTAQATLAQIPERGGVGLVITQPGTVIHCRKFEIKELPPTPEPLPSTFKNSLGMEFVVVPKGKSWLGGGKDKLGGQEVEIPADFYLGKFEVTQEEWEKVMGENPSQFSRTGERKDVVKDVPDEELKRFPVEMVSWDQCQIFVAKLNRLEKVTGWVFRLPTEVEWEYACRGGPMSDKLDSVFDFYLDKPVGQLQPEQANFQHGQGLGRTCKVGSYQPNKLGLYDMHGNLWEFCENFYNFKERGSLRLARGGSWFNDSGWSRAAARAGYMPPEQAHYHGLRLARVPAGAPSLEAKTLPAVVAPFVILAKDQRGESAHATLADAAQAAQSGDTIEIRGDGPFVSGAIDLGGKALAIRAGAGFRPVIQGDIPGKPQKNLITTKGRLVLEGLDFWRQGQGEDQEGYYGILGANGPTLHVAHCRMFVQAHAGHPISLGVGECEVRNCLLVSGSWHCLRCTPATRLTVENCVLAQHNGSAIFLEFNSPPGSDGFLHLARNTLLATGGIESRLYAPPLLTPDGKIKGQTPLATAENLFCGRGVGSYFLHANTFAENEEVPASMVVRFLRERFDWKGDNDLHTMNHEEVLLAWKNGQLGTQKVPVKEIPELAKYFATGHVAVSDAIRFHGGDLHERIGTAPESLLPDDFRLADGSAGKGKAEGGKDAGADVDLVGPGEAYEKWKQTTEYQEWRKQTDALSANAAEQ